MKCVRSPLFWAHRKLFSSSLLQLIECGAQEERGGGLCIFEHHNMGAVSQKRSTGLYVMSLFCGERITFIYNADAAL